MVRVAAAAAVATIGAEAVFTEINWAVIGGVALLAAIIEGLVCIANLPEAPFPGVLFSTEEDNPPNNGVSP
jgi:hypothetical protein